MAVFDITPDADLSIGNSVQSRPRVLYLIDRGTQKTINPRLDLSITRVTANGYSISPVLFLTGPGSLPLTSKRKPLTAPLSSRTISSR